jgi:hypothetical protein
MNVKKITAAAFISIVFTFGAPSIAATHHRHPAKTSVATAPAQLPDLLGSLMNDIQVLQSAQITEYENHSNAVLKQHMDDRVACVGMGTQECRRMIELHSIEGVPYDKADTDATVAAYKKAQADAQSTYLAYKAAANPSQAAAARKLYIAWMAYISARVSYTDEPIGFDENNPVAANAWNTAVGEFRVDSL